MGLFGSLVEEVGDRGCALLGVIHEEEMPGPVDHLEPCRGDPAGAEI